MSLGAATKRRDIVTSTDRRALTSVDGLTSLLESGEGGRRHGGADGVVASGGFVCRLCKSAIDQSLGRTRPLLIYSAFK